MKNYLKKNALNFIILILFVVLAVCFARYHEHWADEAQSWLIARDNSIIEILNYTKYEGTPCLWFFILKIFINIGFTYEMFYLIPILFTTIGLYLVLFKIEMPWYIKILFPFSYFIFFQTTIVCRSYCLVLPAITLIYIFYKERFSKPTRFFVSIIFFMNISLHTYLIAGSIFAIYLYDFYKKRKELEKSLKIKNIICSIILFFVFLIILILLFPKSDIGFGGDGGNSIFYIIGEATISSYNNILNVLALICIVVLLIRNNNLENIVKILVLFLPVFSLLMILHCQIWHISIIFEVIFVLLIKDIDKKEIKIFVVIMLLIQCIWNIITLKFDYENIYSPSEQIADFIKEIDSYESKKIYGIRYMGTTIQPYFEKNIFSNYNTDKANYCWSTSNGYYTDDEVISNLPDICIIPYTEIRDNYLNESLEENSIYINYENTKKLITKFQEQNYILYAFEGDIYTKNLIEEKQFFLVYVNKEIEEELLNKNIEIGNKNLEIKF